MGARAPRLGRLVCRSLGLTALVQLRMVRSLVWPIVFGSTPSNLAMGYSTAEQIAEVVYEAATDGKTQLRYLAGEDAKALYAQRKAVGDEAMRAGIDKLFFG